MTATQPASSSVRPPDLPAERFGRSFPPARGVRGGLGRLILTALILAFLLKSFVVQAFYIPSESMMPTLDVGDRVLVEKLSYRFGGPARGDVIVFRNPGAAPSESLADSVRSFLEGFGLGPGSKDLDLIKRVVGLPGETVEVRAGVVHVNGAALPESYQLPDGRTVPPVVVPAGQYWMLGDNRGNSRDSRFGLGTVREDAVIGRAFLVLWPPGRFDASLGSGYVIAEPDG